MRESRAGGGGGLHVTVYLRGQTEDTGRETIDDRIAFNDECSLET